VYAVGLAQPRLESPQHGWRLGGELWDLEIQCKKSMPLATRKENAAFVRLALDLSRYVKNATGTFNDELVGQVLGVLLADPEFDMFAWRKRQRRKVGARGRSTAAWPMRV
jgi:hypothetical protein